MVTAMIADIQPVLDMRMQLGECPIWHAAESALYWIDIEGRTVHRLHVASNKHDSWPMPAQPGCIAICASGGMVVALRSGIVLLDTTTGQLTPLTDAPYDQAVMRFNDGRVDASGRLWLGTMYEPRDRQDARLFRFERGELQDTGKCATVSNGPSFSPDDKTIYHTDTTSHTITAYDFDVDAGSIFGGRILKSFSRDRGAADYGGRPDGGVVDSEGCYWAAMYEGGRLLRLSPEGDILRELKLPVRCPTMMAFGGDDLRTLFITTVSKDRPPEELARHPLSGYLLSMRVDVPGQFEHAYVP